MSKNPKVDAFLHKLFGTTPGEGMQPKEAIAYSVAGFGQNFICTIIGSYLTVFMTDALGFDLNTKIGVMSGVMAVAWLMLGTRIFDAFNDPIMGSIVDRTRTKWGKCRPYLKWMAIPIGIVTILCFLPWYPKTGGGFAALSVIYVIWSVVYTVADVPYWGLSSAMTNNTDSRGKMLTVARLACTLGAGIVTVFVPIITSAVTAEYKYNELAVQTPVIVYQINDVNDSSKNIYVFDTEMQKHTSTAAISRKATLPKRRKRQASNTAERLSTTIRAIRNILISNSRKTAISRASKSRKNIISRISAPQAVF